MSVSTVFPPDSPTVTRTVAFGPEFSGAGSWEWVGTDLAAELNRSDNLRAVMFRDEFKIKHKTYRKRLAICQACGSLDRERMVCTENKCRCFVERKARWASQECPLGKWKAVFKPKGPKNLKRTALESETAA